MPGRAPFYLLSRMHQARRGPSPARPWMRSLRSSRDKWHPSFMLLAIQTGCVTGSVSFSSLLSRRQSHRGDTPAAHCALINEGIGETTCPSSRSGVHPRVHWPAIQRHRERLARRRCVTGALQLLHYVSDFVAGLFGGGISEESVPARSPRDSCRRSCLRRTRAGCRNHPQPRRNRPLLWRPSGCPGMQGNYLRRQNPWPSTPRATLNLLRKFSSAIAAASSTI
jgi:hypothetical protein